MITREVAVTIGVKVTVDETKFTPEFLEEYRTSFYKSVRTLDDHIKNLAVEEARGRIGLGKDYFLEGYGPISDLGIQTDVLDVEAEIEP